MRVIWYATAERPCAVARLYSLKLLSYFAIVIVLADFGLLALARKLFVRGRLAERV